MSRAYHARLLLLRKTKLGEADLIVTALTSEGHQVRAVAKGARKSGSRFGARIEPFTVADALLAHGRSLDVLAEIETVTSHERLRSSYDAVRAAAVVTEFLDRVTAESDAEPRLYELGLAALDAIEASEADTLPALVAAFLIKGMAMLGVRPQLAQCVSCGGEVGAAAAFSLSGGGVSCRACAAGDPSAVSASGDLPRTLACLLRARFVEVAGSPPPGDAVSEALRVLAGFMAHQLATRLRALDAYVRG